MSTITTDQQQAISRLVSGMALSKGLGDKDNACSIAAINLALTGELTDRIPPCMSEVIGRWIISVQDAMPSQMRNSSEWKRLLPLAAGTGREREHERLAIVMKWMWSDVLPTLQPLADQRGFGEEWRTMLEKRTRFAAATAKSAAYATTTTIAARAVAFYAVAAAENVICAVDNARSARVAVGRSAEAIYVAEAAEAAARAAESAASAAARALASEFTAMWQQFDPCGLMERLIAA